MTKLSKKQQEVFDAICAGTYGLGAVLDGKTIQALMKRDLIEEVRAENGLFQGYRRKADPRLEAMTDAELEYQMDCAFNHDDSDYLAALELEWEDRHGDEGPQDRGGYHIEGSLI